MKQMKQYITELKNKINELEKPKVICLQKM